MLSMRKKNKKTKPPEESEELDQEDYADLFKEKKKELLLENRRQRVTTMSFHDWFTDTYKRDFKQSDKDIADAYHAGASDNQEDNEYILDHTELKMQHYKNKAIKLADEVQILYALLDNVNRKSNLPESLSRLVKKTLNDLT